MKIVKLSAVLKKPEIKGKIVEGMRKGDIFIYPTDTIYGIGCNAEIPGSVEKIRSAKGKGGRFSVAAPDKEWIWDHAVISKGHRAFADSLLPGPYTIVVKAKSNAPKSAVSREKSLGVRMYRHPFYDVIREAGVPFISTSVNLSGKEPASRINDVPDGLKNITDVAIDAGEIRGHASRVFDLRTDEIGILRH